MYVDDSLTDYSMCQGDTGGPILHQSNGQWIIFVSGVASFGIDCITDGYRRPKCLYKTISWQVTD